MTQPTPLNPALPRFTAGARRRHSGSNERRAGRLLALLVVMLAVRPLGATAITAATVATIQGAVFDSLSGDPVVGASVRLLTAVPDARQAAVMTAADGSFVLDRPETTACTLRVEAFGYRSGLRVLSAAETIGYQAVRIRLQPLPLRMDEVLVQARRETATAQGAAFVESIQLQQDRPPPELAGVLNRAVGVGIRRTGGLGSFSTVSVRGSTAEQVLIYLDGVPLNQALGGGVDLGNLPVSAVERIDVYRGAVPARFGGNSIGGVVHIRTQAADGVPRARIQAMSGSWGTHRLSGILSGARNQRHYLALVELAQSDNDFRFLDDKGTEYNLDDDEWTRRLNSDFRSGRLLARMEHPVGAFRLQVRTGLELNRQGIPSISNNQSLNSRLNRWRASNEAELFGALPWLSDAGVRLNLYHLMQEEEYRDLDGTVGVGRQHDRNRTISWGTRAELNHVTGGGVTTLFGQLGEERFNPENLLRPESWLPQSRRRSAVFGWEVDLPLLSNLLHASAGSQSHVHHDRFYGRSLFGGTDHAPSRDRTDWLHGGRVGARLHLWPRLTVKGHRGWYNRPPSFYELFGDRGAVAGNTRLTSERGDNWDVGFHWIHAVSPARWELEVVYFRNHVRNLIRFLQNAQRVSVPQNIGRSKVRGTEMRASLDLPGGLRLETNHTYQIPENFTRASYERGNDLPNAPRHSVATNITWRRSSWEMAYELSHESRHYLDTTNLRTVPARTLHGLQFCLYLGTSTTAALEVRNLTNNQVADLWGYPLPGRSVFGSLSYGLEIGSRQTITP